MIEITKDSLKGIPKHRENDSHKHQYGHLLVVAGCKSMPGAAIMATGAALKSGCGLVTLHSCEKATSAAAVKYPSAMQQISLIPFTMDSRHYMTDIEKIVRESTTHHGVSAKSISGDPAYSFGTDNHIRRARTEDRVP